MAHSPGGDYCRYCGELRDDVIDLVCAPCHKMAWWDRYHFDASAAPDQRWRPVVNIRDKKGRL